MANGEITNMAVGALKAFAPALATALGGPLAGAAASFIAGKLGLTDKSVEAVSAAVAGMSGAELVKMKELDHEFEKFMVAQQTSILLAQAEINKEDAKSGKFYNSGWRPAAGWISVIALGLIYIPKAVVLATLWTWQAYLSIDAGGAFASLPPYPDLGVMDIVGLLGSLLGIGTLRSMDHYGLGGTLKKK